jgi:sirohydrochlorin cobaltochelatase
MPQDLTDLLAKLLEPGHLRAGQLVIHHQQDGFELRHADDEPLTELEPFTKPEDARRIAQYDEAGTYRPLKTAPNLRRGWRLNLRTLAEVRQALDYFYPAMLGVWRNFANGKLTVVPLRETLRRQTGMYAITRKLTDPQAQALVGNFCRSDTGCLKKILWEIAPGQPVESLPREKFALSHSEHELPLLCHEICNLLVAKARASVKLAAKPS